VSSSGVTQLNLATIDGKMAGMGHLEEAGPSSKPSFTPDFGAYCHPSLTRQVRDLASGAEW
jgi:hypothetical protein